MAFTDTIQTGKRGPILIAVAALHGAAIYALASGLAVNYIDEVITRIEARNIPTPPPEVLPPPPQPREPANEPELKAPEPRLKLPNPGNTLRVPELPDARVPYIAPPTAPDPGPGDLAPPEPPAPRFAATGAKPLGKPGAWVGPSDYPTADLRAGNAGTVGFRLAIDASGRVTGCTITATSGHAGLDAATCKFITRRARFAAASDPSGAKVAGTYANQVTWVIPE